MSYDIYNLLLKHQFSEIIKPELKSLINGRLNNGIFHDNYDVVIKDGELSNEEVELLIKSLYHTENLTEKDFFGFYKVILDSIGNSLPMSYLFDWPNMVCTDGLSVVKISSNKIIWQTDRISLDGISLTNIKNNIVKIEVDSLDDFPNKTDSVELNYENGAIVSGNVIKWSN